MGRSVSDAGRWRLLELEHSGDGVGPPLRTTALLSGGKKCWSTWDSDIWQEPNQTRGESCSLRPRSTAWPRHVESLCGIEVSSTRAEGMLVLLTLSLCACHSAWNIASTS